MLINHEAKSIEAKLVYAGPDLNALFHSVAYVFKTTGGPNPEKLSDLSNLTHGFGVPLHLGTLRGMALKFMLVTSPTTQPADLRAEVFSNADGLIFVASSASSVAANLAALSEARTSLASSGFNLEMLPRVLQADVDEPGHAPALAQLLPVVFPETIASRAVAGVGVFDALKSVSKQVLVQLQGKL